MNGAKDKITAVPTNIITGFLGAGKTSAIMHLLKQKPSNERWAILVNEFGEIGIDGELFTGQFDSDSIFIDQVPGGCMCCASGLPMQIALNLLLQKANPDRLLIEPTGLGHPKEVLELLSNQHYKDVLNVQQTITLVDARNLQNKRYTEHQTFNQQLEIADIIIGNKVDLYKKEDQQALTDYLNEKDYHHDSVHFTEHGQISIDWLEGATNYHKPHCHHHHHQHSSSDKPMASELAIPACGFIKAINQGEGYSSIGWRFAKDRVFNRGKLKAMLTRIEATRVKGTFITDEGMFGYNNTADGLSETELVQCPESRIEIICNKIDDTWEQSLINLTQLN